MAVRRVAAAPSSAAFRRLPWTLAWPPQQQEWEGEESRRLPFASGLMLMKRFAVPRISFHRCCLFEKTFYCCVNFGCFWSCLFVCSFVCLIVYGMFLPPIHTSKTVSAWRLARFLFSGKREKDAPYRLREIFEWVPSPLHWLMGK